MTEKEFAMVAMAIKTYYPEANVMPNQQAFTLWFNQLKDLPYKETELAVNKWVATNKWCPKISDIRATVAGLTNNIKDYGEAWQEVINAISKYGYYQADKALESMSELTREAVKRIGFTNICMSEYIISERAQFEKIYNALAERKKESLQLPPDVRELIAEMACLQIEQKK